MILFLSLKAEGEITLNFHFFFSEIKMSTFVRKNVHPENDPSSKEENGTSFGVFNHILAGEPATFVLKNVI